MTARLTDEQIAELRALDAARTQGDWVASKADYDGLVVWSIVADEDEYLCEMLKDRSEADARFIAAAANALPALLTERDALRADLLDAMSALDVAITVVGEAREKWDQDMRAGKLLIALIDPSLKYRAEITAMHATRQRINDALNALTTRAALGGEHG